MLRKDVVCDFVLNLPSYPCGKKIFSQRFLEKIPTLTDFLCEVEHSIKSLIIINKTNIIMFEEI